MPQKVYENFGLPFGGGAAAPKVPILQAASAGDSTEWLPIAPYPERLAYSLDTGSTATSFTIDVSENGSTSLGQAFTGSWASSAQAEITYPLLFSDVRARYFKITVTSGGPITFLRGA